MKKARVRFNQYVRNWMENYRNKKSYSVDQMSEALLEDSRSYFEQKGGRMGFSGITICRMLIHLSEAEGKAFINGLKQNVWPEEFEEE